MRNSRQHQRLLNRALDFLILYKKNLVFGWVRLSWEAYIHAGKFHKVNRSNHKAQGINNYIKSSFLSKKIFKVKNIDQVSIDKIKEDIEVSRKKVPKIVPPPQIQTIPIRTVQIGPIVNPPQPTLSRPKFLVNVTYNVK